MAISVGNTSGSGALAGVSSSTHAHDNDGDDVIVLVALRDIETAATITGVTYAGAAMTQDNTRTLEDNDSSSDLRVYAFRKQAAAGGSNNVVVTFSGATDHAAVFAISLSGLKATGQPNAIGDNANTFNSPYGPTDGTDPSAGLTTTVPTTIILDVLYHKTSQTLTKEASQTQIGNVSPNGGGDRAAASYKIVSSAGAHTMSWSQPGSPPDYFDDWAQVVVAYAEDTATASVQHTTDALLKQTLTLQHTVDAFLGAPNSVGFTLDAYLSSNVSRQVVARAAPAPPRAPRFLFVVESNAGSFIKATEDWDFRSITREVNGSMEVELVTDRLVRDIGAGVTDLMNALKIRVATPQTGPGGIDYFSGYFPQRDLSITPEEQPITLRAMGHASRMFEMLYRDGSTIAMDFTTANSNTGEKASVIAQDVIDKVRALDATYRVNYSASSVEDSSDKVRDRFKLMAAGDVLNRLVFLAFDSGRIWHWRVLGDNVFQFRKNSTAADHSFTFGKDVSEFTELREDLLDGKNEVFVQYNAGANVRRRANAASITAYGNRSLVVTEHNIVDQGTADELGDAYLATYLPPIRRVRILVMNTYERGIENIHPGDTCRVQNVPQNIASLLTENMFIVRTKYMKDRVELELSLRHPQIGDAIEHIRRRFEQAQTDAASATTYA